jgi:antirestriction protein ArdC
MGFCMKNVTRIDIQQAVTNIISLELEKSSAERCDDNEVKGIIYRNTFSLFDVDQVDGLKNLPEPIEQPEYDERDAVDAINRFAKLYCARAGVIVRHRDDSPYYSPVMDVLVIPISFRDGSSYAVTLVHELIRSTGHEKRLNRFRYDGSFKWCRETHAFENLVVELGTAFVCDELGIQSQQRASYISNSTQILKSDKTSVLFKAAVAANKAYCYLMGCFDSEMLANVA